MRTEKVRIEDSTGGARDAGAAPEAACVSGASSTPPCRLKAKATARKAQACAPRKEPIWESVGEGPLTDEAISALATLLIDLTLEEQALHGHPHPAP